MPPKNVTTTKAHIDRILVEAGKNNLARSLAESSLVGMWTDISHQVIKNLGNPNEGLTEEEAKGVREYNKKAFDRLRV